MQMALPHFIKTKSGVFVIGLIFMLVISNAVWFNYTGQTHNEQFGLKGSVQIIIDNKTVFQADQLTYVSYATLFCKLFNDTTACSNAGNSWDTGGGGSIGTLCKSGSGATPPSTFYSSSYCTMTAIALSTDTNTNLNLASTCPSINASVHSGPHHATTSFTANTQQISLTATFTPYVGITVNKVCMIAWQTVHVLGQNINTYFTYDPTFAQPFAVQVVSPAQSISGGQPFTVVWTFSA